MAPAKGKKRKPAVNPNRGFATQSIASKPKSTPTDEPSQSASANDTDNAGSIQSPDISSAVREPANTNGRPPELHELSPEDLERRLEEADVQNVVDKFSAKSLRDSSRYVAKAQTDCRLLRSQAMSCSLHNFLPEEIVSEILALAADEVNEGKISSDETSSSRHKMSENESVSKLWTLKRTLLSLGFSISQTDNALKYVHRYPPSALDAQANLWGLDEGLDYIALNTAEADLPIYETNTGKPKEETEDNTFLGMLF